MPEPIDLLLVEDDPRQLETLELAFEGDPYRTISCASWDEVWPRLDAVDADADTGVDVALLDLYVGSAVTTEQIPELRRRLPGVEMIVMTAQAEVETAVAAMKLGASDYLKKPVDLDELEKAVAAAAARARLRRENAALRRRISPPVTAPFIAASPKTKALLALVDRLGGADVPALVLGETGVGKDVVARRIHLASGRRDGPFVPVNAASIPRTLAMAELFGHERGAFTGAVDRRLGVVELADGGTFFLDEVGDMPPDVQAALLRFLESGEFRRVGGRRQLTADVRVIAATNKDLRAEVAAGRFRSDLYYRLDVATIEVPPLRDRPEDVAPLAQRFLEELGREEVRLSPAALDRLRAYRFPGNVRQLRNVIARAAAFCDDDVVLPDDLSPEVLRGDENAQRDLTEMTFAEVERLYLERMLDRFDGNKTRAAKAMGLAIRTVYSKVKKLGLDL